LQRGQQFIIEHIPFCKQEQWNFIKVLCFGQITTENNICDECKPFILSFEFDAKRNAQVFSQAIKNQFHELWANILKAKPEKGKMVVFIILMAYNNNLYELRYCTFT
jgi:hypothetical protein